ncbi:MAG: ABC transporter substrate-binding protein [Candidatus Cloacimonadales bacterium]|jgi:multiple sugar transport system substrate-binding protein|nr:ABC transporter substrate-binding protein [Candidatus Cloacimonadota bacterium]MDX9977242.1 ABC transporter substrate-binding protein [Candidatus Cloacimonadales bacterium]
MKKYYAIWLIIALLVLSLTVSCTKIHEQKHDKTEIKFWHALGGPLGDALTQLVDEFNREQDSIFVRVISMGNYQALSQKLMASLQANNQPEIAQVFESWTANFIEGNVLVPIDEFIEQDSSFIRQMDDFYPVFIDSNTINGKIWSFPFNKSLRVLFYNKDAFYREGLDHETGPKTWEDFKLYAKVLSKDHNGDGDYDIFGSTFAISAWQFENLLLQAGGQIMNEGYTKAYFNSDAGVEAIKFMSDLLNIDKTVYLSTGYDGQNDFLSGKIAMLESSSVTYAYLQESGIPFNLGVSAIPEYKNNKSIVSGTNVAIFKMKDKKKEKSAWEFIKWFTDTKQTARFSEMTYYMPVRKSAMQENNIKTMLNENKGLADVYAMLESAEFEPQIPEWFELRKYIEEQVIEKVFRGLLQPKNALDLAAKKLNTEIEKNKKE